MLCHDQETRYARHISLPEVGEAGQIKLGAAKVLVVGAGGLGAPLLLYLAAAGVGHLGIVDADRVALSNLPRQILYETADVGRLKTQAAREALYDRNPEAKIHLHNQRLDASNAAEMIAAYDVVADGSDNFETRLAVNAACVAQRKTLVSAAVIGFSGQLATFKPHAGIALPCYECLTGGLPPEGTLPDCRSAGVLNSVTGMLAAWQATEIMKEILGIGESLAGVLLRYDGLRGEITRSQLLRDPACGCCGGKAMIGA